MGVDINAGDIEVWSSTDKEPEDDFIEENCSPHTSGPVCYVAQAVLQALFLIQAKMFISDSCVEKIIGLLKLLLFLLQSIVGCDKLKYLCDIFPSTLYMARKIIGINRDLFTKYVVCSACQILYEEAWKLSLTRKKISRTCQRVLFPNLPHVIEENHAEQYL